MEAVLRRNAAVLRRLSRARRLGVVSNFYGNVDVLCREAGLAESLEVVVDSARVGVRKPDLRDLPDGAGRLGAPADRVLFVGDSPERDLRPAQRLGMRTVWLKGPAARPPQDAVTARCGHRDPSGTGGAGRMKMGIIAAGTGERLAAGGVRIPKPLVPIAGQPLIARAIAAGAAAGAGAVACIVNDLHPEVARFLRAERWPVPVEVVVKTTPNSMESLFALAPHLDGDPFLLSTVDAVFAPAEVARFLAAASALDGSDGVLALTRHVDDEKPLWAAVDERSRITALGAAAAGGGFVTAGVYYFTPGDLRRDRRGAAGRVHRAAPVPRAPGGQRLPAARGAGRQDRRRGPPGGHRGRRALLAGGRRGMSGGGILGVYREQVFSPGKIEADAAVLDAALEQLSGMGRRVSAVRAESLDGRGPARTRC